MTIERVVGNIVLLKEITVEEQTEGGLIISSKAQSPIYEIVAIGETANKENLFSVGDKVLIRNTVGDTVYLDKVTKYKYVHWWEIEAIVS